LFGRGLVVSGLDDRVVASVGLPLRLDCRGHRVFDELPRGLLLLGRAALHDVERRAADDVAAIRGLVVRSGEETRADLEFRGVDVAAERRARLEVHRGLAGLERGGRAGVVDAGVVEVPAVDAGLPPIEDRLTCGVVVDDPGIDNAGDRKSTRLNSSHLVISYAVFCLKKKNYHILE